VTAERRWLKDQPYALARRTLEQRRRLAPSPEVNELLNYLLLHACQRNAEQVEVTAYCALSNHHHLLVTDLEGGAESQVSDLCRDLHATIAKSLNHRHDRSGVVWDPARSFSQVEVHGFEAEVQQWVYVAGQAVAAGLVERPEDWPGICWLPEDVGRTLTAERPEVLFTTRVLEDEDSDDEALREAQERLRRQLERSKRDDLERGRSRRRRKQLARERERRGQALLPKPEAPQPSSDLPETVSYTVPVPKCLRGWKIEDVRSYLRAALNLYVSEIHEKRAALGLGFLGVESLRDQDPHTPPPGTKVATASRATYQRIPRMSTRGLDDDSVRELKNDLAQWHEDYAEALELLRSPTPQRARFPRGTHLRAREQRRIRAAYRAQAPPRAA